MTASTKPKTPSMTMTVRPGVSETDIDTFCKKATRLALSHVVDRVIVKERLTTNGSARSKDFTIEITFYPEAQYRAEYNVEPAEILAAFGTKFPVIFKKELQTELKKLDADLKSQIAELGKGKTIRERAGADRGEGDGDEGETEGRPSNRKDDDETSEVGDGDASAAKRQRQTREQATYEDDDDEDVDAAGEYDEAGIEAAYASPSGDESDSDGEELDATGSKEDLTKQIGKVEQIFMHNLPSATSFAFSDSGCTIGLQVSRCIPRCA